MFSDPLSHVFSSANRYLWLNYRVHLLRTNNRTNAIDFKHARTEGALRAIRRVQGLACVDSQLVSSGTTSKHGTETTQRFRSSTWARTVYRWLLSWVLEESCWVLSYICESVSCCRYSGVRMLFPSFPSARIQLDLHNLPVLIPWCKGNISNVVERKDPIPGGLHHWIALL